MRRIFLSSLLLLILAGVLSGCPQTDPKAQEKTKETVEEARKYVESIEPMKEDYYNDYFSAQRNLADAEENLSKRKYAEAEARARESLRNSKRILKQFYLDTVAKLVDKAKQEIEETVEDDPDTALQDFLPQLDTMLFYAQQLQSGSAEADLDVVVGYLEQATQIKDNIDNNSSIELKSDVSFAPGSYELSPDGKAALEQFIRNIISTTENTLVQFPKATVVVKIKSVGYTDEQGFNEGTNLIRTLTTGYEHLTPASGTARREFLNQRLSELRAGTINNYLKERLLQVVISYSQVLIEQDIVGHGEKKPENLSTPYPISDPRRRLCKVYSYVITR